jgi:hypothetical protein
MRSLSIFYKGYTEDTDQTPFPVITIKTPAQYCKIPHNQILEGDQCPNKYDLLFTTSDPEESFFACARKILSNTSNSNITFFALQDELEIDEFKQVDNKAHSFIILCPEDQFPSIPIAQTALKLANKVELYFQADVECASFKYKNILLHSVNAIHERLVKRIVNAKKIGCILANINNRLLVTDCIESSTR